MRQIVPSTPADLPVIGEIYETAREFMRQNGNPNQWGNNRPVPSQVERDVREGHSYLILEDGQAVGVFSFLIGEDPTYQVIEGGNWINNEPYGVIHKIAGNGKAKGILHDALEYAEQQIGNLRIDTHRDNTVMQHLLAKNRFTYCGIIYTDDGTQRLAYQRVTVRNPGHKDNK